MPPKQLKKSPWSISVVELDAIGKLMFFLAVYGLFPARFRGRNLVCIYDICIYIYIFIYIFIYLYIYYLFIYFLFIYTLPKLNIAAGGKALHFWHGGFDWQ